MELVHKYRPKKFKEVVGQPEAVSMLQSMVNKKKVPHAIVFTGPSGVGKTTFVRILRTKLSCNDADYMEVNAAKERGLDMARDISAKVGLASFGGCRIWCLDEAHQLTKDAQNGLLKVLEDTPSHAYFFLCTTDPSKLIRTIRTRCTTIALQPVSSDDLETLVKKIAVKEKIEITDEEVTKIADVAEGSPREAVKILDSISSIEDAEERSNAIRRSSAEEQAINICRCMMDGRKTWKDAAKILKAVDEDPEGIRQLILAYFRSIILNSGNKRAAHAMDCLREPIYSSPKPLLTLAIFDFYHAG